MKKTAKANNVPVIALSTDKAERRFESMKAAAAWIVKEGLGRSLAGAQHTICSAAADDIPRAERGGEVCPKPRKGRGKDGDCVVCP